MILLLSAVLTILWLSIAILALRYIDPVEPGEKDDFSFIPLYFRIPILLLAPVGLIIYERHVFLPRKCWRQYE